MPTHDRGARAVILAYRIVGALCGFVQGGAWAEQIVHNTREGALGFLVWLVCVSVGLLLPEISSLLLAVPVAFHELGHLVAGRAVKFELMSMAIGPVILTKTPKGLRWKRGPNFGGGFVAMRPTSQERIGTRTTILILGGIVASIVFLGGMVIVDVLFLPQLMDREGPGGLLLIILNLYALACLAGSIIPYERRGADTDARVLLLCARHPAYARLRGLTLKLSGELETGSRARDWDVKEIEELQGLWPSVRAIISSRLLLYYSALDRGEIQTARAAIEDALNVATNKPLSFAGTIQLIYYETAYIRARMSEIESAKEVLTNGITISQLSKPQRFRAEAAIAAAGGESELAHQKAEQARDELAKDYDLNEPRIQAELEWTADAIKEFSKGEP